MVSAGTAWAAALLLCSALYRIVVVSTQCRLVKLENAIMYLLNFVSFAANNYFVSGPIISVLQVTVLCDAFEPHGDCSICEGALPELLPGCGVPIGAKILISTLCCLYTMERVMLCQLLGIL